jgi:BirA family transcriptional regulator, biotin operon repressor / biotin---[acetyl-CoA-carboxylase] ligase
LTDYDQPLQLLQQLSSGVPQPEALLLERLQMTPSALHETLLILKAWGVTVVMKADHRYQLATPPPRLSHSVLCQQSHSVDLILIPVLSSTNQYLLEQHQILRSGTACVAEYQTAGRGRRGRPWLTTFGSCALFSMLWRWPLQPYTLVGLSLALSLVTAEILQGLGVRQVQVKWPNDLYVEGCKLGGLLIETTGTSVRKAGLSLVIGCGINRVTPTCQPLSIQQPVVGVEATGVVIAGEQLIGQILRAWRVALPQFAEQGLAPYLTRWPSFDALRGQRVHLQPPQGSAIIGIARGIDQQGALLIEHQGTLQRFIQGTLALSPALRG